MLSVNKGGLLASRDWGGSTTMRCIQSNSSSFCPSLGNYLYALSQTIPTVSFLFFKLRPQKRPNTSMGADAISPCELERHKPLCLFAKKDPYLLESNSRPRPLCGQKKVNKHYHPLRSFKPPPTQHFYPPIEPKSKSSPPRPL